MACDLISRYSVVILKEMFKKAKVARSKLAKTQQREASLVLGGVGTSRYWKTKGDVEFYYNEIQNVYKEMAELDRVSQWADKTNQDRYSFVMNNEDIFDEYIDYVATNRLVKEEIK